MEKIYYELASVQKKELEILVFFDQFCKERNIQYSLSGGTLLGAVRHKGFIPWDDDVDVLMTRENYEAFLKACEKGELPGQFFMQTIHSDPYYYNSFGKLLDTSTPALIAETEKTKCRKGLCIDIFPIDRCAQNNIARKFDNFRLGILTTFKYSNLEHRNASKTKKILYKLFAMISELVGINRLLEADERIKTRHMKSDSSVTFADYVKSPHKLRTRDLYPYDLFVSYSEINFCGRSFMVMRDYKKYLEITYGDYMQLPPIEDRKPDHNFFYYK